MKKNLFVIGIGFLFIGASILSSCEGPEGPMGPAGPTGANGAIGATGPKGADGVNGLNGVNGTNGMNGKDGINGTDGKDANSSCLVCHTVANFDAKINEYHFSKHYTGNTSARNGKYCAKCHTHEGFQELQGNGKFASTTNDMPNATRINCKTCHAHSGFDFSGDTVSQILTTTSPVYLNYNKNLTSTDFGKINNLCVTCHQIRGATAVAYSDTTLTPDVINKAFEQLPYFPFSATKDDNANVSYLAGRSFSVHDGNQSNLFKGINGYEYNGVDYSTSRTWKHSDAACTDCHMNTFDPIKNVGGHTLLVNEASCTACHSGSDKITPIQSYIDGLRVQLGELLTARKVFKKTTNSTTGAVSYSALNTHDFNGKLYANDGGTYATSSSNNTVSPTTGLVIYGNILKYAADADNGKRIGREWKMGELGAAYNYGYINSELSKGVHNPKYAAKLLQASIDWLNANPAK
jgi:hypothetical protein